MCAHQKSDANLPFPLQRKQALLGLGRLLLLVVERRCLLLLLGTAAAAAEVRREVLRLHLHHVLAHPDVGDVPAGAVHAGGDGGHAERAGGGQEVERGGEERGQRHADGGRGLPAPPDPGCGGGQQRRPAVEREVLAVVPEHVVVAEAAVPEEVHGAAHGGGARVGARRGARAPAQPGQERRRGRAVLEAVRRAAAQEAVQAGQHHAAVGELEAAVREGGGTRGAVGPLLREEEAAGRGDHGRVQARVARLLLTREVHHLAAADVDPCMICCRMRTLFRIHMHAILFSPTHASDEGSPRLGRTSIMCGSGTTKCRSPTAAAQSDRNRTGCGSFTLRLLASGCRSSMAGEVRRCKGKEPCMRGNSLSLSWTNAWERKDTKSKSMCLCWSPDLTTTTTA
uniref:Uncharacterized protein n=1 Tax=Zea mays TaxID=4577 RepID=A0A804LUK6_MAIZE